MSSATDTLQERGARRAPGLRWRLVLANQGRALAQVLGVPCRPTLQLVQRLTRDLAAWGSTDVSLLNANGLPFQWCISLGAPAVLRFVTDTGVPTTSSMRRVARGRATVESATSGFVGASAALAAVAMLSPGDETSEGPRMGLWAAGGVAKDGAQYVQAYVNQCGTSMVSRWQRLGEALSWLGPAGVEDEYLALLPKVAADWLPVALAVGVGAYEGLDRIKLYARVRHETGGLPLDVCDALLPSGAAQVFKRSASTFADALGSQGSYGSESIILCVEFRPRGRPGIKLDFDLGALGHDDVTADVAVQSAAKALHLYCDPYVEALRVLADPRVEAYAHRPALAGLGINGQGVVRMNIYLCPDL